MCCSKGDAAEGCVLRQLLPRGMIPRREFQVEVGVGEKRILRKNVGGKGGQSNVVMRFL